MRFRPKIKIKYISLITIAIVSIMLVSAYFEITSSRDTMYSLLSKEATSLVNTITYSSENTLLSNNEIENLVNERLYIVGNHLVFLDSLGILKYSQIPGLLKKYNLSSIIFFDNQGQLAYSSVPYSNFTHSSLEKIISSRINTNRENSIIETPFEDLVPGQYFIGFRLSKNRGAVLLSINNEYFLEFRKRIGIGRLIQNISKEENIKYIILQDEEGILLASRNVKEISSINEDPFLKQTVKIDSIASRNYLFQDEEVLEVVKPLMVDGSFYGLFRIGLSMTTIKDLDNKMIRRVVILSLILIGIGTILFSLILINQHYNTLQFEFKKIQSYTDNILENMADGIIAIDKNENILFINKSAENIFEVSGFELIGKKLDILIDTIEIKNILAEKKEEKDLELISKTRKNRPITIRISISYVYNDSQNIDFTILVVQDITEEKLLTQQIQRNEKLVAMGELAAGVAHEIRNPLNSIAILTQRLAYEFEPKEDITEYHTSITTIRNEISRLNRIVEQFLKFARRPKLTLEKYDLSKILFELIDLVKDEALHKNISMVQNIESPLESLVDKEQMKQAILNIFRNSIEAIDGSGEINVSAVKKTEFILMEITDNGKGIQKKNLSKIFNLYFTTKPEGSGIGLSIVHQIIDEHRGKIEIESEPGKKTSFKIYLPPV